LAGRNVAAGRLALKLTILLIGITILAGFRVLTGKLRVIEEKIKAESVAIDRSQKSDRLFANKKQPLINLDPETDNSPSLPIEEGELRGYDHPYPESLQDFFKGVSCLRLLAHHLLIPPLTSTGVWSASSTNSTPQNFKSTSGHIVLQILTKAHGHELKHVPPPEVFAASPPSVRACTLTLFGSSSLGRRSGCR
jgi:hypothetical protein